MHLNNVSGAVCRIARKLEETTCHGPGNEGSIPIRFISEFGRFHALRHGKILREATTFEFNRDTQDKRGRGQEEPVQARKSSARGPRLR